MAEIKEKPHRTGLLWLDLVIAVSAIAISTISLWVALREDRTQERLLAASVWPYLQFSTSNIVDNKNVVSLDLINAGVGPARVRWLDLYYHGRPIGNPRALFSACCLPPGKSPHRHGVITEYMQHRVLVPHELVHFVAMPLATFNSGEYQAFNRERLKMYVRACYCSVLDDCWILDSREEEPSAVRNCPTADSPLFQG